MAFKFVLSDGNWLSHAPQPSTSVLQTFRELSLLLGHFFFNVITLQYCGLICKKRIHGFKQLKVILKDHYWSHFMLRSPVNYSRLHWTAQSTVLSSLLITYPLFLSPIMHHIILIQLSQVLPGSGFVACNKDTNQLKDWLLGAFTSCTTYYLATFIDCEVALILNQLTSSVLPNMFVELIMISDDIRYGHTLWTEPVNRWMCYICSINLETFISFSQLILNLYFFFLIWYLNLRVIGTIKWDGTVCFITRNHRKGYCTIGMCPVLWNRSY